MTDEPEIRGQVNRGLAWVGTASAAVAVLDIVAHFILLAVWISPEEYGTAIYALSLFPVFDLATDMGLASAVVQHDDHTPSRLSTIFWLNAIMSLVLSAALVFGLGPALAWLYDRPIVAGLLSMYAIKLVWQNVYYIPYALMKRELQFKELSVIRMLANLTEFGGKIGFAAAGFGVWAFVAGPLCRVAVTGVGVQIVHPWRPQFVVRVREAWHWLAFGIKASAYKILFYVYTNVDYHIVGYYFGETASGLYAAAYHIVLEPCRFISEVVQSIAFPAFARLKNARGKLIDQFVSLTRMNLVVVMGFLGVVFVAADEILAIMDAAWVPAAPAVRILCAVGVLRSLSFVPPPLLDGLGHPGKTLVYTIVAAIVVPGLFVLSAVGFGDELGFLSVAYAWAVGYPIAFVVLFAMTLHVLAMRARRFLARTGGIALEAGVAGGVAWLVGMAAEPLPLVARAVVIAVAMLGVFGLLLARFEGITPRSVARAMRGQG